jgi:hypothetical protein
MKTRQIDELDQEDSISRDFSDDTPLPFTSPKLRHVLKVEEHPYWNQHFSTHNPMIVLVHNALMKVCRGARGIVAETGDIVLLTPGIFELHAIPAMRGGIINLEYVKFPLSIVAKIVRDSGNIERLALRPENDPGAFVQKRKLHQVLSNIEASPWDAKPMERMLVSLINSGSPSVFPFLRSVFFNMRWAFLAMMESYTLNPGAVEHIAKSYVRGRAAFFEECKLYTGLTPLKWFRKRRMQLADAWLHATGKPAWEVAAALRYKGVGKFRREYRKFFHRHPEDPGIEFGCERSLELDSPFCCLRPFWWPYPLPLGQHDAWGMIGTAFADGCATPSIDLVVPVGEPEIQTPESKSENPKAEECADRSAGAEQQQPQALNPRKEESRTLVTKFMNLESISIAELLPFPTDLPVLLKAA